MNFNYLVISSTARIAGESNYFPIKLPQPVIFDEVQLISAQIPYTYYNITSSSTLVIEWNSVQVTVVLTPGNYSLSQLAAAIQTYVQAQINSNITVTFNVQQFTFTFNFSNATPSTGSLLISKSTMGRILGFPGTNDILDQSVITSTSASQSMDQQYLYINLDPVPQTNLQTTISSISSFYIPITVNAGDLITYMPTTNEQQKINCSKTFYKVFNVSLRDMFGNLLDLNNVDWSFVVKLSYKESADKKK